MIYLQITHIHKDDRMDPTTSIQWVGGIDANRNRWRMEMRRAAEMVRAGQASFFTLEQGRHAEVEAVLGPSGLFYLRTDPDGSGANNLLHLPELDTTFKIVGPIQGAGQQQHLGLNDPAGLLHPPTTASTGTPPSIGLLSSAAAIKPAGFLPESQRIGLLNWPATTRG